MVAMKSKKSQKQETHPQFPSGDWEGFFTYQTNTQGEKTAMALQLDFADGKVSGGGADTVGGFVWNGAYDTDTMRCKMTKSYTAHDVLYDGHVDENGIWGTWFIPPFIRGGFHIWPKKRGEERAAAEVKVKKKVKNKKNKLVKSL